MRMFSKKYSKISWCQLRTYDEVIDVTNGYAEVSHPNSIDFLKMRRDFVEMPQGKNPVETEITEEAIEEPKEKEKSSLTFTLAEPSEEEQKTKSLVQEVALTEGDVEALVSKPTRGPGKKKSGSKRVTGRRKK